jgi:glycerol uptake facilitator-like aquaporin
VYIIAQLLGAMVAAYALKFTFPVEIFTATRGGGQMIDTSVSGTQAFVLEAIATFFLTIVIFGTAVDPKAPKIAGLAIGLTIAADIIAIGPMTGASMNPARTLGPAVASGVFEGQLIYWMGPLVGAVAAALIYEILFIRREPEPLMHGELTQGR